MTLLISPQSCVRPTLISPPLAACSGESQLHTHLYCFHSSYAGRGGSTEEGRQRKAWQLLIHCQWKHVCFQRLGGLNHSAICDHLVHHTHTSSSSAPQPVSRDSLRYFSLLFVEREPFKVQICPLVDLLCLPTEAYI